MPKKNIYGEDDMSEENDNMFEEEDENLISEEEDENSSFIYEEDDDFWKDYNYLYKKTNFMDLTPHDAKRLTFADLYWYMNQKAKNREEF